MDGIKENDDEIEIVNNIMDLIFNLKSKYERRPILPFNEGICTLCDNYITWISHEGGEQAGEIFKSAKKTRKFANAIFNDEMLEESDEFKNGWNFCAEQIVKYVDDEYEYLKKHRNS